MQAMEQGPLAGYMPYTGATASVLRELAQLKPRTLAVMHGSSFQGDAAAQLTDLAVVLKENFDHG
jgi:hypothetical protein